LGWGCNARVDTINDLNFLRAIKEAGCNILCIGVESGNQMILDRMNKKITLQQISRAFNLCKKVGIRTSAFFMIGMPGESFDTVHETITFAKRLDPDYVIVNQYTPLPKTALWEYCIERGLINETDIDWLNFNFMTPTFTENLTSKELQQLAKRARTTFMMPTFILRRLCKSRSITEFLNLIRHGLKRIRWFFEKY